MMEIDAGGMLLMNIVIVKMNSKSNALSVMLRKYYRTYRSYKLFRELMLDC